MRTSSTSILSGHLAGDAVDRGGRLRGKRSLAVLVMTLILLMVLVVPLSLAIIAIADSSDRIVGWAKWLTEFKMPPPPDWVAGLPLVGAKLQSLWQQCLPPKVSRSLPPGSSLMRASSPSGWSRKLEISACCSCNFC